MENIIENNKLIAEFMGTYKAYDGNYSGEFSIIEHGGISHTKNNGRDHTTDGAVIRVSYSAGELLYHELWDWLMPVIFKILNDNARYAQQRQSLLDSIGEGIESAYNETIKIIKTPNYKL